MKKEIDSLVLVSDLHAGSKVGMLAPGVPIGDGNIVEFGDNVCQRWLWENWLKTQEKALKLLNGRKFALVVNGDATEGIHHRSKEVIASDIEDHTKIAIACLKEFSAKASSTFVTKGTECHTEGMESLLAERLKAVTGEAQDKWLIRIQGTLIEAMHHMPCTSRTYLEAGALSAILNNARANCLRAGHECPQIFLRAHRHTGGVYSDGQGMVGVCGAWQFLTRHGKKVVPESIPRPSILVLTWEGGALPTAHHLTCAAPQDQIHVL